MHAEKMILETDAQGRLKTLPTLLPNRRVEAIFLVLDDPVSPSSVQRRPAPAIAGQGKTLADLIAPIVSEEDWNCLLMIVLDIYIWFWWINLEYHRFSGLMKAALEGSETLGVSVVSCYEIALAVQRGRLWLPCSTTQ